MGRSRFLLVWAIVVLVAGLAASGQRPAGRVDVTASGTGHATSDAEAGSTTPGSRPAAGSTTTTSTMTTAPAAAAAPPPTVPTTLSPSSPPAPRQRAAGGEGAVGSTNQPEGGIPLPPGTPTSGPVDVTGSVTRAGQGPVAGACVEVWGTTGGFGPAARAVSDAAGRFSVTFTLIAHEDRLRIRATDCTGAEPGFAQRNDFVIARPFEHVDVPMTVTEGAALHGVIATQHRESNTVVSGCVQLSSATGQVFAPIRPGGTFLATGMPAELTGVSLHTSCDEQAPRLPEGDHITVQLVAGETVNVIVVSPV